MNLAPARKSKRIGLKSVNYKEPEHSDDDDKDPFACDGSSEDYKDSQEESSSSDDVYSVEEISSEEISIEPSQVKSI